MKQLLSIIAMALLTSTTQAAQRAPLSAASCNALLPYGMPSIVKPNTQLICRQGYFELYDQAAKIPVWTAWQITPATVNGCVPRSNKFAADQSLPAANRATPDDYVGTGYDKGHMANDSHQSWDQQVEEESFLMINMTPQLPGFNRGIWKLLETSTGAWTYRTQHVMQIYAGPIYNLVTDKKIGKNNVDVPTGFYKIVIDTKTGTTLAFMFHHVAGQGNDLTLAQTTVAAVEKATGIKFGVPSMHDKSVKETIFPTDFKSVAAAKKKQCGPAASVD